MSVKKHLIVFRAEFLTLLLLLVFCPKLLAASLDPKDSDLVHESPEQIYQFFQLLGTLNQPNPMEAAGSHASDRYFVGWSWNKTPMDLSNGGSLVPQELQMNVDEGLPDSLQSSNFWLIQGLFYPLDLGLSYGYISGTQMKHISGYLQANIYEDFTTPAIALRAAYSQVLSLTHANFSSSSLDLISSWGWRFLTAYTSLGIIQHQGLFDDHRQNFLQSSWNENSLSLGLSAQVIPAFLTITGDARLNETQSILSLKMSVDL